ncbi:hypothetical protein ACFS5J_02480 [Flavobacterium chuncheonense]|uniref:ATP-binding protein n=1 Tax=Flavobacterium chuncheonense TaxID=2026653 RepID=A0ABW5YKE0_9FLAO
MKNKHFYSSILVILFLLFTACNKDESEVESEEKYDKTINKVKNFETEHKLNEAFHCLANYINDKSTPLHYLNKAKLELARLYQMQGDFIEGENLLIDVLNSNTDESLEPHIHNILGIIYKEQKQFDKSLEHYLIAKNKSEQDLHKAIIQNNIGVVYLEKGENDNAIKSLKPLINNEELMQFPFYHVKAIDNLGFALIDSLPNVADSLLQKSYNIRDSINDEYGKISSTIHISKLYALKSDTLSSIKYANEAYQIATVSNSPDDRIEALDLLIRFDNKKNWYPLLYKVNDSINTIRQNHKYQFAKIKYDNTKALEQVEKQKNQKYILAIILVFLFVTGYLTFKMYKLKAKREQLQAIYNTETQISKKVHDELANDIFQALSYVEIKDDSEEGFKNTLLDKLDNIYQKSRSISRENNTIDTSENYIDELDNLIAGFNTSTTNIITKGIKQINWNKLKKEKKIAVYRCIQELLVNMKKHSNASLVLISFENNLNEIKITYKDNGIGITDLKIKNGLSNMENRIENVSGKCIFESDNGFKALINIPF